MNFFVIKSVICMCIYFASTIPNNIYKIDPKSRNAFFSRFKTGTKGYRQQY